MEYRCSFCNSELEEVYKPINSERGSVVYICNQCGLIQTKYTVPYESIYLVPKVSCDADWGNIRYGKTFTLDKTKLFLKEFILNSEKILDIGSNRGKFINFALSLNENSKIFAVEPDTHIIDYKTKVYKLYKSKFENISFGVKDKFDFVYCSHTLEHTDNLRAFLQNLYMVTHKDSFVFIEVPNIKEIENKNIVEEFFIDKHTFHFYFQTLSNILNFFGFKLLKSYESKSSFWFLLKKKKREENDKFYIIDKTNIESLKKKINDYKKTLKNNRDILHERSQEFASLFSKVAFWGCGRIFDAIIKYGRFPKEKICIAIDSKLPDFVSKVSGVPIFKPKDIEKNSKCPPEVLIISSRAFFKSIELEAKKYFPKTKVISYQQIFM